MSWGDWLQIAGVIVFAVIGASIIIEFIEGMPSDGFSHHDDDNDPPIFWWF